jgi:uncharacterized protein (DUF1330 family)
MPVYMIIDIEAKDPGTYAEYMEKVPATVIQYGGRYLVRGGAPTSLAGSLNESSSSSFPLQRRCNAGTCRPST